MSDKEIKETEKEEKQKPKNEKKSNSKKDKKASSKNRPVNDEAEKRIQQLEAELEKSQMEEQKLRDQLLRKMAEFENFKRRTEKEFIDNIQSASRELIEELLPVLDDFERTISHAEKENPDSPVLKGVQLVYKNMLNTLTKRGLEPLQVVGNEFNPDEHNALMQVDSDEYESGTVVDEHLKGYKLNDKVIRHAQVLVAK